MDAETIHSKAIEQLQVNIDCLLAVITPKDIPYTAYLWLKECKILADHLE